MTPIPAGLSLSRSDSWFVQTTRATTSILLEWCLYVSNTFSFGRNGLSQLMKAPPRLISSILPCLTPSAASIETAHLTGILGCLRLSFTLMFIPGIDLKSAVFKETEAKYRELRSTEQIRNTTSPQIPQKGLLLRRWVRQMEQWWALWVRPRNGDRKQCSTGTIARSRLVLSSGKSLGLVTFSSGGPSRALPVSAPRTGVPGQFGRTGCGCNHSRGMVE